MKVALGKKGIPILVLTIVVCVAVAILSLVYQATEATIEEQKELKIKTMLGEIFPTLSNYEYEDDIYTIYSQDEIIGYAFLAMGKGYGGNIEILIGLEDETTVKGIVIISHTETPGLGAKITEDWFTGNFAGVSLDDIALKRDGGEIDGITGATISSRAVVEAVRETAMEKVSSLKAKAQE